MKLESVLRGGLEFLLLSMGKRSDIFKTSTFHTS